MKKFVIAAIVVAAALAALVAPWASSAPDGLERVALDHGFADNARDHDLTDGPLADYGVRGWSHRIGTALAGLGGVAVTALLSVLLFRWLARRGATGG